MERLQFVMFSQNISLHGTRQILIYSFYFLFIIFLLQQICYFWFQIDNISNLALNTKHDEYVTETNPRVTKQWEAEEEKQRIIIADKSA